MRRFAFLLAALLICGSITDASVVCYDGFNYPAAGGLNGQNGGSGFGSNPWTLVSGTTNPALAAGSMSYSSGNSSLITDGNKVQPVLNSKSVRNFPTALTTANQTYWISFRANNSGTGTLPTNHAGFHLYAVSGGSGAYIFMGKPGFSATNWGMDLNGSWVQKAGAVTTADRNAFLVYKLVFTTTNVTVSMWINKPLTSEAAMGTPDITNSAAHTTTIAALNVSLGGNSSNYQFDEFRMGTSFADIAPAATLLAYDGFNYTGNLNTQNGGIGYSGAWTAVGSNPNPALATASLTYTSGGDSLATAGNKLQPLLNSKSARDFSAAIPTANQTYWVSFRANNTGTGTLPTNHAGFHLFSAAGGTGAYIFLGKPGFSATNWGMDLNGSWQQKAGAVTTADRNAFLVYKLVFTTTNVAVSMWINKPLTSEAALGTPDLTHSAAHSTNIASMNVSLGANASNYQFDEFRMGTAFSSIAPLGGAPPPPPTEDIVLFAANATNGPASAWQNTADTDAGGGFKMYLPNAGLTQATPLASPTDYFELTFSAPANVPYRLWVRLKADSNSNANDAVHVQFNNSVTVGGAATYRIGSTSGATCQLQEATGRAMNNWGWQGSAFGPKRIGNAVIFNTSGTQTIRIQKADDGVAVDRIVLSPSYDTYFGKRPGAMVSDVSTLPEATNGIAPAPRPAQLRVLEANIHKYRTTAEDGYEPDRTASEMACFDCNVIGTNETLSNNAAVIETMLEDRTGVQWYRYYDGVDNQIMTRVPFDIDQSTGQPITTTKSLVNGATAIRAQITINNKPITLVCTHLDFQDQAAREAQRDAILAWIAPFPEAKILFGDHNVSPTNSDLDEIEALFFDGWSKAVDLTKATAYTDNPVSYLTRTRSNRLDYIWYSKTASALTVDSAEIPDMRDKGTYQTDPNGPKNAQGDLLAIGLFTGSPSMVLDTKDDLGIRTSDHNWMLVKFLVN